MDAAPPDALARAKLVAEALVHAEQPERFAIWEAFAADLPAFVRHASRGRPQFGTGGLANLQGEYLPLGGNYPIALAQRVLGGGEDGPFRILPRKRHPARSRRGAQRYLEALQALDDARPATPVASSKSRQARA